MTTEEVIKKEAETVYANDIRGGFDLTISHQHAFKMGAEFAIRKKLSSNSEEAQTLTTANNLRILSRGLYWYSRAVYEGIVNVNTEEEISVLAKLVYKMIQDHPKP